MATQLMITPQLSDYIDEVSPVEDDILRELREQTATLPAGTAMQVPPAEGRLLTLLTALSGARNVLEIGTFTGYSTLCLARGLPPGGRVVTCDITSRWPAIGAPYWQRAGVADQIDLRIGDGVKTVAVLIEQYGAESFDLVFVDADKVSYQDYYDAALCLLRENGLIVVDNTLYFGKVAHPGTADADTAAIRAFNAALRDDDRVEIIVLPLADGITLARKRC